MFRNFAIKLYDNWAKQSEIKFISSLEKNSSAKLLDLGCGDGKFTFKVAKKIGTKNINAIEGLSLKIKNINLKKSNLNEKFPFPASSFDVIVSNYSIEHLYNTSLFVSEIYRTLSKGGYAVISTDNLASWPNILSLILGYQAFSTTFTIRGRSIGNPYSIRVDGAVKNGPAPDPQFAREWRDVGEFGHNKVLAYKGLVDVFKSMGFQIEEIKGVGYFPFMGFLSNIFSKIDPRHSHLIIIKVRKK